MTLFVLLELISLCIRQSSSSSSSSSSSNCVFSDINGSGMILDLRALSYISLIGVDFQYIYVLTPCRNGAGKCLNNIGMCIQTDPNNEAMCSIVANWDNGNIEPLYTPDDMKWTFKYSNGNNCENEQGNYPRDLIIYYICNETAGDYYILSVGEIKQCFYQYQIMTKWACPNEVYTTPIPQQTIKLSIATLLLIAFFAILSIYFCGGWIIFSFKNRKNTKYHCIDNCPHSTFWSKFPSLVFHGFAYTKDILLGLFCCNPNKNTKADLLEMTQ